MILRFKHGTLHIPKSSMARIHNRGHLKQTRKDLRNNATAAEATLWRFLQKSQLEGRKFRRQHSIGNYIVDFYCPEEKLVVELDGEGHFHQSGFEYDQERTSYLQSLNLRVLRFENEEVFKATESVLSKIKSAFRKSTTPNPSFSKEGNSNVKPNPNSSSDSEAVADSLEGKNPDSSNQTTKKSTSPNPSFSKEENSKIKHNPTSPPDSGGVAGGRGGKNSHVKITSTQNPKIKSLLALEKPRERRKQQLFTIEGKKEIQFALEAGYKIGNLFFCDELIGPDELVSLGVQDKLLIPVSKEVFDKIAIRENSGGVIAVAEMKAHELGQIKLSKTPLVLVLEAVEKPGNLGAILRTADAAGVDSVICCDPLTDFYNPNVIRSSLGCVFTTQLASATSEETIAWLKKNAIHIYCTYLKASKPYDQTDFTVPCAIVMGTEATGLSDVWVKNSTANIIIPMQGKIDSMNVSTSCAVVVFEARRQRSN